jgi:hypothetical protein
LDFEIVDGAQKQEGYFYILTTKNTSIALAKKC